MKWNDALEAALRGWLGPDTWYTDHDYDRERFFRFVRVLREQVGFSIDEVGLCDKVMDLAMRLHPSTGGPGVEETIRVRVRSAVEILEYLKVTDG